MRSDRWSPSATLRSVIEPRSAGFRCLLLSLTWLSGCADEGGEGSTGDTAGLVSVGDASLGDSATAAPDGASDVRDGDSDVATVPRPCRDYCLLAVAACASGDEQYANVAECLVVCEDLAGWPVGEAADSTVNTVSCRAWHASRVAAGQEPAAHCPATGLSGGGTCGSYCDVYCDLAMRNCAGGDALFTDRGACAASCEAAAKPAGAPGVSSGDSMECRIGRLALAAAGADAAARHCPAAAPGGGGVCVDPPLEPSCDEYCAAVSVACHGAYAPFQDSAHCLSWCKSLGGTAPGTRYDTEGDTVGCRLHHAQRAASAGDLSDVVRWCSAAGPTGGDLCGSWCDVWCRQRAARCGDRAPPPPPDDGCAAACAALPTDGTPGDLGGDSVQCRLAHLALPEGRSVCPASAADGGRTCVRPEVSCVTWCDQMGQACESHSELYSDPERCAAACGRLPAGTLLDGDLASVGCRIGYAGWALARPDEAHVWCAAADVSGGGVCGSWCEAYCGLADANCPTLFASPAECATACADLPAHAPWNAAIGNSVQCRIRQLVAASEDPTACAEASPAGGTVCSGESPLPDCATFCAGVDAACSGELMPYDSLDACRAWCDGPLPSGGAGEEPRNTRACRLEHLSAPPDSPTAAALACGAMGPGGAGLCGTPCDAWCDATATLCPAHYEDEQACRTACAGFAAASGGDGASCRLGVVGAGATCAEADATCTSQGPAPTCGAYCAEVTSACPDAWPSEAHCLASCETHAAFPSGAEGDLTGNSVACRLAHARLAATATAVAATEPSHCDAASASGGNVCGSWCDVYCYLAATNCGPGPDRVYDSALGCQAACAAFPSAAPIDSPYGDSVQCRIYHLELAGDPASGGAGTHCPMASAGGGGVCTASDPELPVTTYTHDVQPLLLDACASCHAGSEAGACLGSACFASHFADTTLGAYSCPGDDVATCILTRLKDRTMPYGHTGAEPALPPASLDIIVQWLFDGAPER